jgi:hypothetical protein
MGFEARQDFRENSHRLTMRLGDYPVFDFVCYCWICLVELELDASTDT